MELIPSLPPNIMEFRLANDQFVVGIKRKGAELCSFKTHNADFNYVWQGEAAVWARHAPVLFPIVGKLRQNRYLYQGKEYHLPQHGFARDMDFACRQISETEATFRLESNDDTRTNYPFAFVLDIHYKLEGSSLHITWQVTNPSEEDLYFSIGAHPGFNIFLNEGETLSDYYLEFSASERVPLYQLEGGLVAGVKERFFLNRTTVLPLEEGIFDHDALILTNLVSDHVSLCNKAGNYKVQVSIADFPYLGLWSKPGQPFVCIEPWMGVADSTTSTGDLATKMGIQHLAPGQEFVKSHTISILA